MEDSDTGEDTKRSSNEKRAFILADDMAVKQGRSTVTMTVSVPLKKHSNVIQVDLIYS